MADEVLYELGVDLNSNFNFIDGDLQLASYDENLVQAVVNRLNTQLNSLGLFYEDYGSVLHSFFGLKANDITYDLIKVELNTVLNMESRISSFDLDMEYDGDGVLHINLSLYPVSSLGSRVDANLVLNSLGDLEVVEIEED